MGMRCASAAADVLAQVGVLDKMYAGKGAKMEVFCPEILRTELFSMAKQRNWTVERQEGTLRRVWEKD